MLPPTKTPPPRPAAAVEEDENETIVLNRRSFPARSDEDTIDDPSDDDTRKLVANASDDAVTGDEFTRLHPKNLGRGPVDEEHTNFRPFHGAARSDPEAETRVPLHPPAAGMPAPSNKASLSAFEPLTPERIQAQLDAAREARRMHHAPLEGEGVFAGADWGRGRGMESADPVLPMARSMHASHGREQGAQPTVSWAFALAAMAIIGSVATVAIVEGSGDDLLRTGAEFVDPSMAHTDAKAATPSTQPIPVMDLPSASPPPASPTPLGPVPPVEPAPPPVVSSAPVEPPHAAAPKPPAPKAPRAPAASAAKAGPKKSGARDEDIANAAAADALAKGQLQQSL